MVLKPIRFLHPRLSGITVSYLSYLSYLSSLVGFVFWVLIIVSFLTNEILLDLDRVLGRGPVPCGRPV